MKDPICCPLRVDTFLAVTDVKPMGPEKHRKTLEQKRQMQLVQERCLFDDEEMPEDFWD